MRKLNVLKWTACSFALLGSMNAAFAQQDAEIKVKDQKQEIIVHDNYETIRLEGLDFQVKGLNVDVNQLEKPSEVEVPTNYSSQSNVLNYLNSPNRKSYKGEKPFLGVGIEIVEAGVKVTEIYKNSAAEAAQLLAGDILTTINNRAIVSFEELKAAIAKQEVGDQIQIGYLRNGQVGLTTTTLRTDQNPDILAKTYKRKGLQTRRNSPQHYDRYKYNYSYGYRSYNKEDFDACKELEELRGTPFIGVFINMDLEHNGADITNIFKESDAPNSDLSAGDQIIQVNRFKVSNFETLREALENFEPGDRIRIKYARDGKIAKTAVTLSSMGDRYPYKVKKLENLCAEQQPVDEVLTKENKEETTLPVIKEAALNVFPNPAVDIVNIQFDGGIDAETSISVLDIQGKEVLRQQVTENPEQFNIQLNLSELATGVYLISLQQGDQVISKQISLK